jgi:predicted nucleic acid-binding protein
VIFDTDVLIFVFRGNRRAARLVDRAEARSISIVTYMELLQGARSKSEQRGVRAFLVQTGFATLPLTETIGQRAATYMEEHALGGGLFMADALIAATAVEHALTLSTANAKHFRAVRDLSLKVLRP